ARDSPGAVGQGSKHRPTDCRGDGRRRPRDRVHDGPETSADHDGKGLVVRDESARTHIYAPASTQDQTQRQMVTDLLDRVFDGSAAQLVMQALAAKRTTPEELAEIR